MNILSSIHSACQKAEEATNHAVNWCGQKYEALGPHKESVKKAALIALGLICLVKAPLLTLAGLVVGLVFKREVECVIEKVKQVFASLPLFGKVAAGIAIATTAILLFPITAFCFGAYASSKLPNMTFLKKNGIVSSTGQ